MPGLGINTKPFLTVALWWRKAECSTRVPFYVRQKGPLLFYSMTKRVSPEAVIWLAALAGLAIVNPETGPPFTICPLANMGLEFCPGCGLGRSVSYLFRGEVAASWHAHPLGIFAVIVLSYRIVLLTINANKTHGQSN
jgi:hypothetical protein